MVGGGVTGIYVVHSSMALLLTRDFFPRKAYNRSAENLQNLLQRFRSQPSPQGQPKTAHAKTPMQSAMLEEIPEAAVGLHCEHGRKHAQSGKTLVDGTAET